MPAKIPKPHWIRGRAKDIIKNAVTSLQTNYTIRQLFKTTGIYKWQLYYWRHKSQLHLGICLFEINKI